MNARLMLGLLQPVRQQQAAAEPPRRSKKKAPGPAKQQVYIDPVSGSVRVFAGASAPPPAAATPASTEPPARDPAPASYLDRVASKHGVWTHSTQPQPRSPPRPRPHAAEATMAATPVTSSGGAAAAAADGSGCASSVSPSSAPPGATRAAAAREIEFCDGASGGKTNALKFCSTITREEIAAAKCRARSDAAAAAARELAATKPAAAAATAAVRALQKQPKAVSHVSGCTCGSCRRKRKQQQPAGINRVRYHRIGVPLVTAVMEASGLKATAKNDWNVMWTVQHLKAYHFKALQRHQFVNQFPRTHECCNKSSLARNVSRMGTVHGAKHFDFVPRTFMLPKESDMFHREWERCRRDAVGGSVPWMVKPASSACGRGIYITEEFDDCPTDGLDEFVVSRYIPNPLLLNGVKFDLRVSDKP